jgi:hypothetical protein
MRLNPVSASYGFEDATGEVRLKIAEQDAKRLERKTVTVMIAKDIVQKTPALYSPDLRRERQQFLGVTGG